MMCYVHISMMMYKIPDVKIEEKQNKENKKNAYFFRKSIFILRIVVYIINKTKGKTKMKNTNIKTSKNNKETNMNEVKEVKKRRTFKEIILRQLDMKGKNLPDYSYDPIRETIAEALNELEILIAEQKKVQKYQKNTFRKLAKFTKEEIENYLKEL